MSTWMIAVQLIHAMALHEYSHGWVARHLGDRTAEEAGRLTLNPLAHLSPVGSLLVPAVLHLIGLPMIGWCKPLPMDSRNFANPIADAGLVSAAGPAMNLVLAAIWLGVALLTGSQLAAIGLAINLAIGIFNLLPIPGFDGWQIARALWHAWRPLGAGEPA